MTAYFWKSLEVGFFLLALVTMVPFMAILIALTALGALAYLPYHLMNLCKSKP
jgi:hypothetical protein